MNIGIRPSVNFTKQKRAKPGISVCSRSTRLLGKSQRKSYHPPKKDEKATTRLQWLLKKLYHNWVASRKTRRHRFLKVENSPGKPDAKSLGTDLKSTVHSVYAASGKLPVKRKDHRLEKYRSKIFTSEVPTL